MAPGFYRLWVRTMDWVPSHHPGRFKVVVAGTEIAASFGEQGEGWVWDSDIQHLSCNAGMEDKYTLQISGFRI